MTNYKWLNTLSAVAIGLILFMIFVKSINHEAIIAECTTYKGNHKMVDQECVHTKIMIDKKKGQLSPLS